MVMETVSKLLISVNGSVTKTETVLIMASEMKLTLLFFKTEITETDRQTDRQMATARLALLRKPLSTLPALTESERGIRIGRSRITATSHTVQKH